MSATVVHRLPVEWRIERASEPSDIDAFNDALKVSSERL
jgi:hypothetical protein